MFEAIGTLISMWWSGFKVLPFFDTGFTWAQVVLFLIGFSLLVPVLGLLFGGRGRD